MKRPHLLAALGLPLLLGLAGCGDSGGPPRGAVTVTVTPTVTAKATTAEPTPAAKPAGPTSDVKGRGYDFGTVTTVRTQKGIDVITLDRWTWKSVDDAKLATDGVPLAAFTGKVPYSNQNAKLTFHIPVVEGARILYHHCVAADQPLQTKSVTAKELVGLGDRENLVLVKLDDAGRLVAADNVPGCPG